MRTSTGIWRALSTDEKAALVSRAAAALSDGRLVVLPTETLYGLAASATNPEGLARLERATDQRHGEGPRLTWHAPGADRVCDLVDLPTAVHRRLVAKFLPGPVRFVLEQTEDRLAETAQALRTPRGVIEDGASIAVRSPDHEAARRVLTCCEDAVVARRVSAAGLSPAGDPGASLLPPSEGGEPEAADGGLAEGDLAETIDDGPLRPGLPSTTISLKLSGAFEVAPGGAVPEADVLDALHRTILFVCTGNTCRSPMAEAIARELLRDRPEDGLTIEAISAGVAAGEGVPAAAEAVEAMRRRGIDLREHRSRRLTRRMIERAEAIWTMTPSHAEGVLDMDPTAADKVRTLDPGGAVADPIGSSVDVYEATRDRLESLIAARLRELEL